MAVTSIGIVMLAGWVTSVLSMPWDRDEGMNGSPTKTPASAAGIRWSVPSRWTEQPARSMRIATYAVPAAAGERQAGECAVFYFGQGQGGNVEENVERWSRQFEGTPKPARSAKDVNGLRVNLVALAGAYLAPSGPMMQSQGRRENYRLQGAIVEAPEGPVFFKCTGPAETVTSAQPEFDTLIDSIAKK